MQGNFFVLALEMGGGGGEWQEAESNLNFASDLNEPRKGL